MEKKLSIVIVSYNNLEILVNCIESIEKFNDIGNNLEIVIIENSYSNEIFDYIKTNYTELIIVKNENKGFGQANNIGAKIANGDYLLFLNPDTILIEPIFDFAISRFENNSHLSLFGLKLLNDKLEWNMSYYFIDKHSFLYGQIIKLFNMYNIFLRKFMYVSGANIFVRKNDFFKAGMFDEKIFLYYEEPDLIKRIKKNGGQIGFFKSKRIIHLEGKTTNDNEKSLRRRLASAKYYSEKYGLDFKKQLNNEILYCKIKHILYKLLFNKKQDDMQKKFFILQEFEVKC